MCFSFFLLRDYFLALSFCMQEFSWTTCDTSWTPALFWPLAVVREMSLKVHLLPHTDSRGRQEGESKELLLCLHILIESFWRLKMNPASLVSRVDVYAELNVACYLCPSGPELLFNFSVICTQWKESVFRFKHMCIHKQLMRLEKSIVCSLLFNKVPWSDCPGCLLAGISWGLLGASARWECFLHYFVVAAEQYPYHISLVYLKLHFTACVTFSGDFSP